MSYFESKKDLTREQLCEVGWKELRMPVGAMEFDPDIDCHLLVRHNSKTDKMDDNKGDTIKWQV